MGAGHWQPLLSRSPAKYCHVIAGSNPGGHDGYTMARLDEAGLRKVVLGLLLISGLALVVRWS
jgi:hypothetical protein